MPSLWWRHVGYGGKRTMWECEIDHFCSLNRELLWVRLKLNPGSVRLVNKENLVVVNG